MMLKDCAESISPHLETFFNLSISKSKVLLYWKQSRVTPVFRLGRSFVCVQLSPNFPVVVGREVTGEDCVLSHVCLVGQPIWVQTWELHPGGTTLPDQETLDAGGSELCIFLDLVKTFDSIPHHCCFAEVWGLWYTIVMISQLSIWQESVCYRRGSVFKGNTCEFRCTPGLHPGPFAVPACI